LNLDPAGLVNNIYEAAAHIDFGRKGFATRGKAEEGRIIVQILLKFPFSSLKG
jgi:hypothetical protein